MIVAAPLPSAFPDLVHLAMLKHADRALWPFDETFSRKSLVHRGKIRTPDGTQWLTLPVHPDDKKKPLGQVRMADENWAEPALRALELNYRSSVYFDFYEPEIRHDFSETANMSMLIDVIRYFSSRLFTYLEWEHAPEWIESSDVFRKQLETLKPSVVWVEPRSRYYRRAIPKQQEPSFDIPEYRQHFEGFEPGCCALDLLFQYGPEAFRVLDQIEE